MMRAYVVVAALIAGAALWAAGGAGVEQGAEAFPHAQHQRLFPVCEGCHAGLLTGSGRDPFPVPSDCAACHDGDRVPRVAWRPREGPRVSNLLFSHIGHRAAAAAAGDTLRCQVCHAPPGDTLRMNVGAAAPERCSGCHAHAAASHLQADIACDRCHVRLAEATALPLDRVANLPRPEWHDDASFATTHGATADGVSCAVCHARETCARCHPNADRLPAVAGLPRDTRVAVLETGRRPTYSLPDDHDGDWNITHADRARAGTTRCANCHTTPGCTRCHVQDGGAAGAAIAALPKPQPGAAPGVTVRGTVHTPDIGVTHGVLAAAGRFECARCHTAQACAACHAAQESRAFHLPNFTERHAVEVFAGRGECGSCHTTETFCRACHTRSGVAAQPGMNAAFHNAQPLWVLSHGQAARMGLESCASCHRQNDCVRCHSAAGGWGVNPHGPGFAAGRIAARNTTTCRLCHLGNPLGGSRP
jgi:hypothetical protein